MVNRQVERKRVSYEKNPVGKVFEGWMSPFPSLTTKSMPSRLLTYPFIPAPRR
ncbi:hypothetical protein GA0074692_2408 [Micromonospora pallida]|uniref:Uncharacterized protein n=1 Tax=Micromonospora pallida TaxID=145854 RepID=A0A1C6SE56_9ACTN|nr:hypothetical protein GA0074692_2408 [Micromonospora pallida]